MHAIRRAGCRPVGEIDSSGATWQERVDDARGLGGLGTLRRVETRSISPENLDGARRAAAAARPRARARLRARPRAGLEDLAQRRRSRPDATFDARRRSTGPGRITHLWITTHTDNWRTLVLRAYWDGADEPAVEVPVRRLLLQGWGRFAQVSSQPSRPTRTAASTPTGRCRSAPAPASRSRTLRRCTRHRLLPDHLRARRATTPTTGYLHAQWRRSNPLAEQGRTRSLDGRRGPRPLRRHVSRLGRQLDRLVGRGRDQVLPRRRRRATRPSAAPAPRTTSAAPGTSTCPARATPSSPRPTSGCPR